MILTLLFRIIICVNDYLLHFFRRKSQMANLTDSGPYSFKLLVCEVTHATAETPKPRSGHRIVCDGKNIYSFGGYNPALYSSCNLHLTDSDHFQDVQSFPLFQELWKYNFASSKWQMCCKQRSLPKELASNAVTLIGDFLMVFGGTGSPFGYRCSNQLHMCSLKNANNEMVEVHTTGSKPLPQYGQALVYHNGYLYTIGGTTGYTYTCDIHRLNIKDKVWENVYISRGNLECEPTGRYRHEVAFDGINIFLLGGGTADKAFDFYKIPCFNIETNQWSFIDTKADQSVLLESNWVSKPKSEDGFPSARRCHGAVQIETETGIQIFIIGGYDGRTVFNDLWKLELNTFQWTFIRQCQLPRSIYFHSAAISPVGKLYIFGGIYGGNEITRSNDIMSLWLHVPKLSEMCWEAMLHYFPRIANFSKEELIKLGIPPKFVSRVE